jgi:hypothetical protein
MFVAILILGWSSVGFASPAARAEEYTIAVPGGIGALARAAGLAADVTPPRLIVELARLLHGRTEHDLKPQRTTQEKETLETLSRVRAHLASVTAAAQPAVDRVPSPIAVGLWPRVAFASDTPPHNLFAAIVGDRRASLLYHGLAALDDETLTYFNGRPELLARVVRECPGAFAAFGRSLQVRDQRLMFPGGPGTFELWRAVLDSDPTDTDRSILELLGRRDGRFAFFLDTLAHLDPARLRFALGGGTGDGSTRQRQFKALMDAFSNAAPGWRVEAAPFERPAADPAIVLRSLSVAADGSLSGPAGARFWSLLWEDDAVEDLERSTDADRVDAASIVSRVSQDEPAIARDRLEGLQFVQRLFSDRTTGSTQALRAARAFSRLPALLLTLERIGVRDAATLVAAADRAGTINGIEDESAQRLALAQFQGSLSLVERAQFSGSLTPVEARALVSALIQIPVSSDGGYEGRVGAWIEERLLNAQGLIGPGAPGGTDAGVEDRILQLLAGPSSHGLPLRWEDHLYRVDLGAAELRRLRSIRQRQTSTSVDAALEAVRRALASSARGHDLRARQRAADTAVADAVLGLVYAVHGGDPGGPIRYAPDLARRHDFGQRRRTVTGRLRAAWSLPQEQQGSVVPWHVSGALLALDIGLSRLTLRRMSDEPPLQVPRLHGAERRTFIRTVAMLNPRDMLDPDRDAIVAALARGRARVSCRGDACVAPTDGSTIDAIARAAGLSEWRRAELRWIRAHRPEQAERFFSLSELYWLGGGANLQRPDAWGVFALPAVGCLCLRFPGPGAWEETMGLSGTGIMSTRVPDLALRLAEWLAELQLPALLGRDTLAFAIDDFLTMAQPAHPDDWTALVDQAKALDRERVEDYISALAATGPLVPVEGSDDR